LPAETVVLATGVQENKDLEDYLKDLQSEFYKIGDCQSPWKKGTLIKNTKFFLPPLLPESPSRGQMPPSPNAQERPPSKSLSPDLNEK
jgi:hypothetical protein